MGGDEIVAEWLGDTYANRVRTESVPRRFSSTSLRLRTARILNQDASQYAYIGKYYSSVTTFIENSFLFSPGRYMTYDFIDLYELGYKTHTNHLYLHVQGINQY